MDNRIQPLDELRRVIQYLGAQISKTDSRVSVIGQISYFYEDNQPEPEFNWYINLIRLDIN